MKITKDLNTKWTKFDTEGLVENVVEGKRNTQTTIEAKNLMNETIKNRNKETQKW